MISFIPNHFARYRRETTGEGWDHLIRLTDGLMITEPGAPLAICQDNGVQVPLFWSLPAPEMFWGRNSKHMTGKHYEPVNDIMMHKHNGDHRTSCLNILKVYYHQWEKGSAGLLKIITRCSHLVTNSLGGRNSLCCIIISMLTRAPELTMARWLFITPAARQLVIL